MLQAGLFGQLDARKPLGYYAQLAASAPCEDRHGRERTGQGGYLYCVLDGHAGVHAVEFAAGTLLVRSKALIDEMDTTRRLQSGLKEHPYNLSDSGEQAEALDRSREVEEALQEAFTSTDSAFMAQVRASGSPAPVVRTGTTALVAYITPDLSQLFVANAGDCRCVMAQKGSATDQVTAVRLSEDHSIANRQEVERIKSEHPDDPQVFVQGYLKGRLQPTRGIGDLYLKHADFNTAALGKTQLKPPRCRVYDPPYVTAFPTISQHRIGEQDAFMVMASDGLWGEVEDSEAVRIAAGAISRGDDPAREARVSRAC